MVSVLPQVPLFRAEMKSPSSGNFFILLIIFLWTFSEITKKNNTHLLKHRHRIQLQVGSHFELLDVRIWQCLSSRTENWCDSAEGQRPTIKTTLKWFDQLKHVCTLPNKDQWTHSSHIPFPLDHCHSFPSPIKNKAMGYIILHTHWSLPVFVGDLQGCSPTKPFGEHRTKIGPAMLAQAKYTFQLGTNPSPTKLGSEPEGVPSWRFRPRWRPRSNCCWGWLRSPVDFCWSRGVQALVPRSKGSPSGSHVLPCLNVPNEIKMFVAKIHSL